MLILSRREKKELFDMAEILGAIFAGLGLMAVGFAWVVGVSLL